MSDAPTARPRPPGISIVVPVFNSEQILPELVHRLGEVLPVLAEQYEVLLVNDASRDASWAAIQSLEERYSFVRGFDLMRNFGQHAALLCGLRHVRFATAVTMDDDLQHPPEELPKLLAALDRFDVVYGIPRTLPHSPFRNLMSRLTKRTLARSMGVKNIRDISAFRAMRARVIAAADTWAGPRPVIDVLLSWGTQRFGTVEVEHHPRAAGRSNYTLRKLFNFAMLILTGYSTGPLRLASFLGFGFTLFGLSALAFVLIRYFIEGTPVPGFPFLACLIAIFGGVQLFALGIMGEYLARIFDRSSDRPAYVVRHGVEDRA